MVMILIEKTWMPVYERLVLAGLDELSALIHIMQNTEVDVLEMEEEDAEENKPYDEEAPEIIAQLEAQINALPKRSPEEEAEFEQFLLRQKMQVHDFRNK